MTLQDDKIANAIRKISEFEEQTYGSYVKTIPSNEFWDNVLHAENVFISKLSKRPISSFEIDGHCQAFKKWFTSQCLKEKGL